MTGTVNLALVNLAQVGALRAGLLGSFCEYLLRPLGWSRAVEGIILPASDTLSPRFIPANSGIVAFYRVISFEVPHGRSQLFAQQVWHWRM